MCLDETRPCFSEYYGLDSSQLKLLHCTAFYAGGQDHDGSAGAYAGRDVVRRSVGKCFRLEVTGIAVTSRTVCAKVDLAAEHRTLFHCDDVFTGPSSEAQPAGVCQACVTAGGAGKFLTVLFVIILTLVWGTGIREPIRGMASLPQGNQEQKRLEDPR